MDRADLHLGLTLATLFAIALHLALAAQILRRGSRRAESRLFALVNGIFAGWQALQLVEYLVVTGRVSLPPLALQAQFGAQLVANLLVLSILFQLLCTFEERYQRPRKSLRAGLTHHLHRRARVYVPLVYGTLVLGVLAYAFDAVALGGVLDGLRDAIGPTSAYLFGAAMWAMIFVLFPARPGQERLLAPQLARAALLVSLGVSLALIAVWHDLRPRVVNELLLPWLHLHTVAFAVFFGFVRYEYPFMARFVRVSARFGAWAAVVGLAYWAFYRIGFDDPGWGRMATSTTRIGVLLGAVLLAPALGDRVDRWVQRHVFVRRVRSIALRDRLLRSFVRASSREHWWGDASELLARSLGATWVELERPGVEVSDRQPTLTVPLTVAGERIGRLRLGPRRNLLPYFDAERRFVEEVAPLIAAGLVAFERSGEPAPQNAAAEPGGSVLSAGWQSELLAQALRAAKEDPGVLERVVERLVGVQRHLSEAGALTSIREELRAVGDLLALEQVRTRGRARATLHYDPELADQAIARGLAVAAVGWTFDLPSETGVQRSITVRSLPRSTQMVLRIGLDADRGSLDGVADWASRIQRGAHGLAPGAGIRVAVDARGAVELHVPRRRPAERAARA